MSDARGGSVPQIFQRPKDLKQQILKGLEFATIILRPDNSEMVSLDEGV
jgi:hypothetical protein